MLGERATTEIARTKDSIGFVENKDAAIKGGNIAGDARKKLEIETKRKVTSPKNYLGIPEKEKRNMLGQRHVFQQVSLSYAGWQQSGVSEQLAAA